MAQPNPARRSPSAAGPSKLRKDGTFSMRFALPDGDYTLPAQAVSADETDARAAELHFTRDTQYRGDVGAHPQDPELKIPLIENGGMKPVS